MKIGFIHPSWPGSEGTGATHTASQIVDMLVDQGNDLTVYCIEYPPQEVRHRSDIHLESLPESRIPHTNVALNSVIRRQLDEFNQYDIVSSYLTPLIPAMNAISEETSAKTLVTLNAYAGVCPKNDLQYMGTTACNDNSPSRCLPCIGKTSSGSDNHGRAYQIASRLGNYGLIKRVDSESLSIDGFHALSGHVKQIYAGFDFPNERITVVPNPIDDSFVVPHESDFSEPYELLYVGYLEQHKGVNLLPELMLHLEESDYEFELTIAGDGGMRSQLEQTVQEFDLGAAVDIRGHVPYEELPSMYARHDIFVYPGQWEEPFGRVFLEAIGTKTPVVATNVGATDEILGTARKVVEPKAAALAEGVSSLIRHGELELLSANARGEIERFEPERIGQEFEKLYKSLV